MSHDDIIDKLKKLMLKEESCRKIGNLEEAALYASKVLEWSLRYKIELASISTDLEKERDARGLGEEICCPTLKRGGKPIWWQNRIAGIVCEFTGCVHCVYTHSNLVLLIGKEIDRQMAAFLLQTITQFIATESQKQYDREYYVTVEKGGAPAYVMHEYRNSWIKGAFTTIRERLEDMKQKLGEEKAMQSMALVLRRDCDAAREWMNKQHTNMKEKSFNAPSAILNHRAHEAGKAAARNLSLSRPLTTSSLKALL